MKYIFIITMLLGSLESFTQEANEQLDNLFIELGCSEGKEDLEICSPFCAHVLNKKIKELGPIESVLIDTETGVLKFDVPSNEKMEVQSVRKHLEELKQFDLLAIKIIRFNGYVENWTSK